MTYPLISICIPAYKRAQYLQRLLDSIVNQEFGDFEVIVTDDSPDQEVAALCESYKERFSLRYHRNEKALGTPENWNAAIRMANGEWIKLMHDDDWFRGTDSLQKFKDATERHPQVDFFFSAYENHYLERNEQQVVKTSLSKLKQLEKEPATLFSSNVIGPPSVVMHRRDGVTLYDPRVKWVVDIEFYIRALKGRSFHYIDEPLVNVGIGSEQVTVDCFRQRQVEIPEAFYLFGKTSMKPLRNILVYDGWWRLLRNLEVRKNSDIIGSGYGGPIPPVIGSMVRWQRRIPLRLLKIGAISKPLMFLHYIYNKKRIS